MSSNTTKLNTSNVNVQFKIASWNANPGQWIVSESETPKKAQLLFDLFVTKKMPEVLKLLTQLNNTQHLSPSHLSMKITSIFLIYITEQIEHYQNQRDIRDLEVDQKLQLFKEAFAKERYQLCTHNPKWANVFFDDLKSLLMKADVLSEDFDKTIALWLKLISIVHVGDITLASCFHKEAKTLKLHPVKKIYVDLQRGSLESSFHMVINQLSQDLKWIVSNLGNKMAFPEDREFQTIFFAATNSANMEECLLERDNYINAASAIQGDFKLFLIDLLSLDFTNNQTINTCLVRLNNIVKHVKYYADLSLSVNAMREVSGTSRPIYCGREPHKMLLTKEIFPKLLSLMEGLQECHLLMDCYLLAPCYLLESILETLITSNLAIEEFNKGGTAPKYCTQSLLPAPSLQQYNEIFFLELCEPSIPKTGHKTNRAKNTPSRGAEKTANGNVDQKLAAAPTPIQVALEKPIEVQPMEPLEQLRRQLYTIYQIKQLTSIRQALWHLDALITLQGALKTTPTNAETGLATLNMAAGSAQKLLEQAYRFCLELRNIEPITSHNLKDYHRALDNSPFPEIVQKLYLANHWTRYFYIENEKWSFSTQVVNIPSLLKDLVNIAEGAPHPKPASIKLSILDIIEKTRAHAEKILPKFDILLAQGSLTLPESPLAEDVPIQVNLPFNLNGFNKIKNSLSLFLTKTSFSHHHPVYLQLKQAIAAIAILKGSLQGIQKAKNPRELATWTSLCTQQIQETIEDILHAIEFFQDGEVSSTHDLRKLSLKLDLEMGQLADDCHQLSYKSRYPVENLSDTLGAQIIDDVETLRQCPEYLNGFKLVGDAPMLWKQPSKNLSLTNIMNRLNGLIVSTQGFLQMQALPILFKHAKV